MCVGVGQGYACVIEAVQAEKHNSTSAKTW